MVLINVLLYQSLQDKNASYDYNDNDADPMPRWALENSQ